MDLEKRVSNLENLVGSLIRKMNKDRFYDSADKAGIHQASGTQKAEINKHTSDIDFLAMETGVELDTEEVTE